MCRVALKESSSSKSIYKLKLLLEDEREILSYCKIASKENMQFRRYSEVNGSKLP